MTKKNEGLRLMLTGAISELPEEDQKIVYEYEKKFSLLMEEGKHLAGMALALVSIQYGEEE
jgi:hypothetical protein